ncbi:MAG: hypothetical protein Q7U04_09145 [Bacteriovorax sp.]|nr:hypothetical protein [Bacteriovorax sp.]
MNFKNSFSLIITAVFTLLLTGCEAEKIYWFDSTTFQIHGLKTASECRSVYQRMSKTFQEYGVSTKYQVACGQFWNSEGEARIQISNPVLVEKYLYRSDNYYQGNSFGKNGETSKFMMDKCNEDLKNDLSDKVQNGAVVISVKLCREKTGWNGWIDGGQAAYLFPSRKK